MGSRFERVIDGLNETIGRSAAFRNWLRSRRWCGEAIGPRTDMRVKDRLLLSETPTEALILILAVAKEEGLALPVHLPLSVARTRLDPEAIELDVGSERVFVTEAERREAYARFLVDGFRERSRVRTHTGDSLEFHGSPLGAYRSLGQPAAGDSSNLIAGIVTAEREVVFKSYKLLDPQNREPAILERLHRHRFPHAPPYLGSLSLGQGEDRLVLGVATERLPASDAFTWLTEGWRTELRRSLIAPSDFEATSLRFAEALGEATAALHEALVDRRQTPFQIETFSLPDAQAAYRRATGNLTDAIRMLARLGRQERAEVSDWARRSRDLLFEHRRPIETVLSSLEAGVGTPKTVTHGDLHLGQVLRSPTAGSLFFVDFEGEPERAPGGRSPKLPPLRDVATMNRSFAYVTKTVWRDLRGEEGMIPSPPGEPEGERLEPRDVTARLTAWEAAAATRFSRRYLARSTLYPALSAAEASRLLRGWMMEKALYELRYELKHRPKNYPIPLEGVLALATGGGSGEPAVPTPR